MAVLVLHRDEPVHRDALVRALWADNPPKSAAKMVHIYVSRLRHDLAEAGIVRTEGTAYRLCVSPAQVDVDRMQDLVADDRPERLREALDLWRGPALCDVLEAPFARDEHRRLEAVRIELYERLFEAELAQGRGTELVSGLRSRVAEPPQNERLRAQLMLALYRAGRQVEALAVYREGRRIVR